MAITSNISLITFIFSGSFLHGTTLSINPVSDGFSVDSGMDGVAETLFIQADSGSPLILSLSNSPSLGIEPGDVRPIMEFDLSSIPSGAAINSAQLDLYAFGGYYNSAENPGLTTAAYSLYGYFGNGVVGVEDLGPHAKYSAVSGGTISFDVRTLIQDAVSANQDYVGMTVGVDTLGIGAELYSRLTLSGNAPRLSINYTVATVPEPSSTVGLLGIVALGFTACRRNPSMSDKCRNPASYQ